MSSGPAAPKRRSLDASMELLTVIQRDAIEPEYAESGVDTKPHRARVAVVVICVLAGLMFTTSALGAGRGTAGAAHERAELIAQLNQAEARNQELRTQAEQLSTEVHRLEQNRLGEPVNTDPAAQIWSGMVPVTGPGVVLTITDNPRDTNGTIVDQDIRQVVNGLWLAGAEAITINGYRLSARTAIRQAGSAVTIDYRSMTTPYRIEAIGAPRQLANDFESGTGGQWLNFLKRNYGVGWSIENRAELQLGADAGLGVDKAGVP